MLYFSPGEITSSLDVFVTDTNGFPITPLSIVYGIYRKEGVELHLVSGSADMPPQTDAVGHYMSGWLVPESPLAGEYRVIWKIQQDTNSPVDTAQQDFTVGVTDLTAVKYGDAIHGLIMRLRTLLRDNNPERNYSFRPPAKEHLRDGVTHHFGYVWEEEELYTFLELGTWAFNFAPPQSGVVLGSQGPHQYPILISAAALALAAVTLNWIADEFDYSIGGKSLTIDKSGKYQAMASHYEEKLREILEQKKAKRHVAGVIQVARGITVSGGAMGVGTKTSAESVRLAHSFITPWL